MIVPGFASHLEVEWEDGACRSFIRRLAAFATVVRFDKRGTGLSDPVQELPTLQERDADLAAVIADAGVDRPVLLGFSEGGSIAVRFVQDSRAHTWTNQIDYLLSRGSGVSAALSTDHSFCPAAGGLRGRE